MSALIKILRGNALAWAATKRILESGELGLNTDNNELVVGDGLSPYEELDPYISKSAIEDLFDSASLPSALGAKAPAVVDFDLSVDSGFYSVLDPSIYTGNPIPSLFNGPENQVMIGGLIVIGGNSKEILDGTDTNMIPGVQILVGHVISGDVSSGEVIYVRRSGDGWGPWNKVGDNSALINRMNELEDRLNALDPDVRVPVE